MNARPILAREIMTKNLVTLSPDLDVFKAIDALLKKRISGAPVVDAHGHFVGIFSESSCMKVVVNVAYDGLPDARLIHFVDQNPPTIAADTDMMTICQVFLDQGVRRLPVLEDGCLVGQVSRRDVMRKVRQLEFQHDGRKSNGPALLYVSAISEDSLSLEGRLHG